LLLLHISDIHFKEPVCLSQDQDPDRPIRTRVARDMRNKLDEMGKDLDGILVGGDIAFKAHPDEYRAAKEWLLELAALGGCSDKRIYVVPGNHDVNRGHIRRDMGIQNVQHRIASATELNRDDTLRAQLAHGQSGHDLLSAHTAYNDFAAPMNCQIYPSKISWHQEIDLSIEVKLRIHGLTSTLLSGQNGDDDTPRSLYLGQLQTVLDPVEDRVNLILCHHPPDWLMDGDDVEDAINARAMLQLFGHKHRQRIVPSDEYVRILAGAVNPSRRERNYDPGYNLIELSVTGQVNRPGIAGGPNS
jgi:predicted MPP superfamily phosphohydrolase